MHKYPVLLALAAVFGISLLLGGCAPLRDQNGNLVPDKNGKEQYRKAY